MSIFILNFTQHSKKHVTQEARNHQASEQKSQRCLARSEKCPRMKVTMVSVFIPGQAKVAFILSPFVHYLLRFDKRRMKRSLSTDETSPEPDELFSPTPAVHTYYGFKQRQKHPHELLIQFRCMQEINAGAYRLTLFQVWSEQKQVYIPQPHACHLDRENIIPLDESGRCFACLVCQRFNYCEKDHRTCPVYEVDGEMLCWFSKKSQERVEIVFDPDSNGFSDGMTKDRGSLKEIYMPSISDKYGKSHLIRVANGLTYDRRANRKAWKLADGLGRLKHSVIATGEYKKELKQTGRHLVRPVHEPEAKAVAEPPDSHDDIMSRDCFYNQEDFTRDNEFYIRYYTPICISEVRNAAARLYGKCCPSKQTSSEPTKSTPQFQKTQQSQPDPMEPIGLYVASSCTMLPEYRLEEMQKMIRVMLKDLMNLSMPLGISAEPESQKVSYYTERVYMLLGLYHPHCLGIWKWGEIIRYTLVAIMGLFRANLILKGTMLWVADPWLTSLSIPLEKVAFRREYLQKAWLGLASKFETHVSHFVDDIHRNPVTPVVMRTLLHSSPVYTE